MRCHVIVPFFLPRTEICAFRQEQACKRCPVMYASNMALSVEMVAEEALNLPTSGRALLVEKLLASLAGEANPTVERAHLEEAPGASRRCTRLARRRLLRGQKHLHRNPDYWQHRRN